MRATAPIRPVLFLSLALGLGLGAPAARADEVTNAQRAYAELDYGKCSDEANRALAKPGVRQARLETYRLLGLCEAALGNGDKAREAFKRMLAVDKDARLPDGLSPRFKSSFREAKGSFMTGAPLTLVVDEERVEGGTRAVRLKLTDELSIVQKIAWKGAGGSSGGPVRAAALLELELPAAVDVTVSGLDVAGGEVTTLLLPKTTPTAVVPPPPPPPPAEEFPWVVVGGVTGGVVALAAISAGVALLFAPPQAVTLKTDVVFGNE